MTYEEIFDLIKSIGYPCSFESFPEDDDGKVKVPPLPYIVFLYPETDDVYADDENYACIQNIDIELYTKHKDFTAEAAVERVLKSHNITYTKNGSYNRAESMYGVLYAAQIVINE